MSSYQERLLPDNDPISSTNSSPDDFGPSPNLNTGKNRLSVKRSISEQPRMTTTPPSPECNKASSSENIHRPPAKGENDTNKARLVSKLLNWWKTKAKEKVDEKKRHRELTEEVKMRHKLQYHFMSPFQKYKHGRKPWKLFIQVFKILIVTTQVIFFISFYLPSTTQPPLANSTVSLDKVP